MNINEIWQSEDEEIWKKALTEAMVETGRDNCIETKLSRINIDYVSQLEVEDFYDFLYDSYFVWKYTAKNRLATSRSHFEKHKNNLSELSKIQKEIFSFELPNTKLGLMYATQINGLGVAGASGLLALLFPSYFGTVDEMVVRALLKTEEFKTDEKIKQMNPQNLKIEDAVYLIDIYRKKANHLNKIFKTYSWTPRNIDVIL
ncbi:hypothetical protein [Enterococcus hirae]